VNRKLFALMSTLVALLALVMMPVASPATAQGSATAAPTMAGTMVGTAAKLNDIVTQRSKDYLSDLSLAAPQGKLVDTSKFKKAPPYTIGFVNWSTANSWTVQIVNEVQHEASLYPEIKEFITVSSEGDANKQISQIEDLVARGVDLFDCVLPARVARHGSLYTPEGRVSIRNARFREQLSPVDSTCDCTTCRRFSAAYLHHLHRTEELLWFRLATIHNLSFILREMRTMRAAILDGSFADRRAAFHADYHPASATAAAANRVQYRDHKRSKTP